jgi:sortase (surface protein transpeptidase)
MRKFRRIALAVLFIGASVMLGMGVGNVISHALVPPAPQQSAAPTYAPTPAASPQLPALLLIPKIHVRAEIESVGTDSQGRMDVPSVPEHVAWYNKGVLPGEAGNAVIDGHVDSYTGPAVFFELRKLSAGDDITVSYGDGREQHFTVTRVASYPYNNFPLQEVFGPSDKKQLNLITCSGTFDRAAKNYSNRLVVYATQAQ